MKPITSTDLKLLSHRQQVQFALFCAKQVEADWKKYHACVAAVAAAEAWLEGKATAEECKNAANAAVYAAYAAANAAYAAAYAAKAAYDKEKAINRQWEYFYSLLGELGKVLYF